MSKKQTAVEWLQEQLTYNNGYGVIMPSHTEDAHLNDYFEKAIQLEREQIEEAYIEGMEFIPVDPNKYTEDAEQYYTETYGKCTQQS